MAIGTGVTEIADSEEELLTSSPAAVSDAAGDKLSATADQDAQAGACPHQGLADHTANQASGHADVLDADHSESSTEVEKAQSDQPEAQPAHETATNNASVGAFAIPSQADKCPGASLVAADADELSIRAGADRADVDAGSLTGTAPELDLSSAFDERVVAQMKPQINPSKSLNDYSQSQLPEDVILTPNDRYIQQNSPSQDCPKVEAVESHHEISQPSRWDHVQRTLSKQGLFQLENACAVPEDHKTTKINDVIAESSHDINHEATSPSRKLAPTDHRDVIRTPDQAAPDTSIAPDPLDLDALPGAHGATSPMFESGQYDAAMASPAEQDASHGTPGVDDMLVDGPVTPSPSMPLGAGGSIPLNHRGINIEAPSAPFLTAQTKPARRHETSSEQDERGNGTHITALSKPELPVLRSAQGPTTATNEQDHTHSEKAAGTQPPTISIQSWNNTLQAQCEHDLTEKGEEKPMLKVLVAQKGDQSVPSHDSECPAASPQEITLAELRAQKTALLDSLRVQPAIQVLMEENQMSDMNVPDDDGEPTEAGIMAAANKIVKEHIKLLHEYNELKDVGQGLMGLIADQRGVRIVEVQDEFGIDAND